MQGCSWVRSFLSRLAGIGITVACALAYGQAEYPSKAIRIIVPAPPGGGTDIVTRIVGQQLSLALGQPVVIDNRGGAGGNVGTELAARAPADGYTLVVATVSHVTNPHLHDKLGYDAIKDFVAITQLTAQAYVQSVNMSSPLRSVKEMIAHAKSKKGAMTYSSSGTGQAPHLGMELLKTLAGFDAVHVPYKGTAPSLVDVMSGHIDTSMVSMPTALPMVRTNKLRAIAVTSLKRSTLLPTIPTIAESGYEGFEVDGWKGLLAPAGTPTRVVSALHVATVRILKLPEVRERLSTDGSEPVGTTPKELATYMQNEMAKWAKVIKQSGAKAN